MLNKVIPPLLLLCGILLILSQILMASTGLVVTTTVENDMSCDIQLVAPARRIGGETDFIRTWSYVVTGWLNGQSCFDYPSKTWALGVPTNEEVRAYIQLENLDKLGDIILDNKDRTYFYPEKARIEIIAGSPIDYFGDWGNFTIYNYAIKIAAPISLITTVNNDTNYEIRLLSEGVPLLENECLVTDWLGKGNHQIFKPFVSEGYGCIEFQDGSKIDLLFDGNNYEYRGSLADVVVKATPFSIVFENNAYEFYSYIIKVTLAEELKIQKMAMNEIDKQAIERAIKFKKLKLRSRRYR